VVDAFKIVQFCDNNNIFIKGVVVNKKARNSDLSQLDVETILGKPVLGVVPEDNQVKDAMKERLPIVVFNPSGGAPGSSGTLLILLAVLIRRLVVISGIKSLTRLIGQMLLNKKLFNNAYDFC
jgi:hypothetical protein